MSFKLTLLFSLFVHLGLLAVRPPAGMIPPRETLHSIELTYVSDRVVPRREAASSVQKRSVLQKSSRAKMSPQKRVQPKKVVRPKPPRKVSRPVKPTVKRVTRPKREVSARIKEPAAAPRAAGDAVNIPESEFIILEYKQMVRDHLKHRLRFPEESIEGDVRIHLVLDKLGRIHQTRVMQSTDALLSRLTLQGVHSAAPYPRFPAKLERSQTDFEFIIQYTLD